MGSSDRFATSSSLSDGAGFRQVHLDPDGDFPRTSITYRGMHVYACRRHYRPVKRPSNAGMSGGVCGPCLI
jgi:hypothetical protein